MKRLALVGVLLALAASTTAAATRWVWTESYAEQRAQATISYRYKPPMPLECQQGIQDRQAAVAQAAAYLQQVEASGSAANIQGAKQTLKGAQEQLTIYRDGCEMGAAVKIYRPTAVVCTGVEPAVNAVRFGRFRCVVTFGLTSHIHILVVVTGRTTFRWQRI